MADPCCCLTGNYDYDGNTFYHEEERKARKEHKCVECGTTIKRGDKYCSASGKSSGRDKPWRNDTCSICDEIRHHFYCDGGWTFTELWQDIREQLFENEFRFECMSGLSVPAREAVLAEWREWKGIE